MDNYSIDTLLVISIWMKLHPGDPPYPEELRQMLNYALIESLAENVTNVDTRRKLTSLASQGKSEMSRQLVQNTNIH